MALYFKRFKNYSRHRSKFHFFILFKDITKKKLWSLKSQRPSGYFQFLFVPEIKQS